MKQPGIADVTRSGRNIVLLNGWTGDNDYEGKNPKVSLYIHPMEIDEDYLDFYGIKIIQGSNFTGSKTDSARLILNETAVKEMGMKDPVGKRLRIGKTSGTIHGVVQDFHYMSMRKKIEPAVFTYDPRNSWQLSVKAKPGYAAQAVAATEKVFKQFHPDLPFDFAFLDDSFNKLYQSEERTGSLFSIFAGIAVMISCLGLFGLATYTAQVRRKEVGIRKVLGASAAAVVSLLSREFIILVMYGMLIAAPLAWYVVNSWLENFAYRIMLTFDVFMISGLVSFGVALLAVSVRTLQAAMVNPVKSIKTE